MKKINFILMNGDNIISDITSEYSENENGISFKYEKMDILFKGNENAMHFKRETEEDVFTLEYVNNQCSSYIELNTHNAKFDIPIINFNYEYTKEKAIFKYTIDDDDKEEKTIIISFIN